MKIQQFQGDSLKYVTIEPDGYEADRVYPLVVLLHGYGSHMGDLSSLSDMIDPSGYVYTMPNAPIEVSLGYGMVGYAWAHPVEGGCSDGTRDSEKRLYGYFKEVMGQYGVKPGDAVLGGFSQGGMMTYGTGLARPDVFRGLICLSGKVTGSDILRQKLPAKRTQSIFVSHGRQDTIISIEDARVAKQFLDHEGYTPEYREYDMGHEISAEVLEDLTRWLRNVLPPSIPS